MIKTNKNIFTIVLILTNIINIYCADVLPQAHYTLTAAGVLPVWFNENNKLMALIGRQTQLDLSLLGKKNLKKDPNVGTFDYFAGGTEEDHKGNSIVTAASEWREECRLDLILKWSSEDTQDFIKKNVQGYLILATHYANFDNTPCDENNTYGVMYIVLINDDMKCKIFDQFKQSYEKLRQQQIDGKQGLHCFLEKDVIALVPFDELVSKASNPGHLLVAKLSEEPNNGMLKKDHTNGIKLRPIFELLLQKITGDNKYQATKSSLLVYIASTTGFYKGNKNWKKQNKYEDFVDDTASLLPQTKQYLFDLVQEHLNQKDALLDKSVDDLKIEKSQLKMFLEKLSLYSNVKTMGCVTVLGLFFGLLILNKNSQFFN